MRQAVLQELQSNGIAAQLEEPTQPGLGDFAIACFEFAKERRQSPAAIAAELASKLKPEGFSVKAIGPYVNFYIDWPAWGEKILKMVDEKYGAVAKIGKSAVIDLSSPNPAHPFHMGTVRSTLVGEAVSRIIESQGWDVMRLCYINDLGRQLAAAMLAYQTFAKGKKPEGKPDVWLGKLYFRMAGQIEETPDLSRKVEEILSKCEKGEKESKALNRKVVDWCLEGFRENWKTMGIKFDMFVEESNFVKPAAEAIRALQEKHIVKDVEGALLLDLEPYGLPSTIIRRSDGTGLYLTRDLAGALWRESKLKPDLNIYVVAEDQKLHFQQLFKTLELLGHKGFAEKSKHLAYSMVLLEGKKMSARKGWFVIWDDLLAEGEKRALAEVKKRWPKLSPKAAEKRAREIALAAITFFIVKYSPEKPVNFVWEQALAFEGETGPYLQYSHARAGAILRKAARAAKPAKGKGKAKGAEKSYVKAALTATYKDGSTLKEPTEIALLKLLAQYPEVLTKAARDLRPHYLAGYLFSLADSFSKFYESVPVLRAQEPEKSARLRLVAAVKTVLASGLSLLGISSPDRM